MQKKQLSAESYKVFFVRGCMRSGTGWIGSILNLHPKISCTGEFYFDLIRAELNRLRGISYSLLSSDVIGREAEQRFEEMVKSCIYEAARTREKPGAVWYGDRTPRPLEPVVVKDAPSFVVRRDGRDILVSWVYHLLRVKVKDHPFEAFPKMKEKVVRFEEDPAHFKKQPDELLDDSDWVKQFTRDWAVRMNLDKHTLQKVESGRLSSPVYVIQYEKLHQDVNRERDKMYQFLKLDPDEAAPLDALTTAGFMTENLKQHNRKGAVGDWRNYFTAKTCDWFKEEAGAVLVDMGYEKDLNWTNDIPS